MSISWEGMKEIMNIISLDLFSGLAHVVVVGEEGQRTGPEVGGD